MRNRFVKTISLAALLTAAMIASTIGAGRSSAAVAAPAQVVKTPMVVVGFDAKVAAANGFALRKEANGSTELVNTRTGAVAPDNLLKGTCGYSWYYLSKRTAKTWTFWTGFTIYSKYGSAVDYSWTTHVAGPSRYSKSDSFGGGLFFRSTWQSKNKVFHAFGKRGEYHGVVSSGHAITDKGYVCYTEHPSDSLKY
jgi:hypothetical protein